MKEKFRDDMYIGPLKTKYWINKSAGEFGYWETHAETLTEQITEIVDYYESIDIKLTNRQLYYQLVGKDYIPNYQEVYKRICVFLTDLRYAGKIDWSSIEDKARVPKKHPEWDNLSDIIKSATYSYRLPRWSDQDYYIEMYCEKEAGINVLETISRKYHMHFGFNKGYSSASAMYDLAFRIGYQLKDKGKLPIILYFGDHDPSGLDMVRDIRDRIEEFLTKGDTYIVPDFEVVPVSLSMDQVKKYKLPPNPAKITDPRAKWYIKEHGEVSWELDAIDAIELRKIAEDAVLEYIDMKKYDAWIRKEKKQIKALKDFGETLSE